MSSEATKAGLMLLCATFRAEVDKWQVRAYERALKDVPEPFILAGADRLVAEATAGRKFYPLPTAPEWKAACGVEIQEARKKAASLLLSTCSHSGHWVTVTLNNGVEAVRRCPCYRQAMTAMDQVATPLALPEVSYALSDVAPTD
jgi:hypothetical protein